MDQGAIADIRTEPLKDGKTNVAVVIEPGGAETDKRALEAKIIDDFIDLAINLEIQGILIP
jgi:hypothetical protein